MNAFEAIAATWLLAAATAGLLAPAAAADACAPIVKAELATARAPAFRQYMSLPEGKGERLLSIALGDTVYMALGGQAGWQTMDRTEILAMAKEAADNTDYRDCKSLGSEAIGGVETAVYQFTMASRSNDFAPSRAKVWIGEDGLLRRQSTDKGNFRYEFDDVKAPVP
jgi:hypothetical protein